METKLFEVRDAATFIPVLAVRLHPGQLESNRYLLARAGFGLQPSVQGEYVLMCQLHGGNGQCACDPHDWKNRTMQVAQQYLTEHFLELPSGAVIDVEFILGETTTPKTSERFTR